MSDNLVAGLDISGFSPDKLARLNEFVAVFKQLEKFESRRLKPFDVDGVQSFNASLAGTNDILNQINLKLGSLNQLHGELGTRGSASIRKIKVESEAANTSLKAIGKTLTENLSLVRTIAYILPGLGIAGVFNLVFEAIDQVFIATGLWNAEILKTEIRIKATNDALREQISLYDQIGKEYTKATQLRQGSDADKQRQLDNLKTRGESGDVLLPQNLELAKKRMEDIKGFDFAGTLNDLTSSNQKLRDLTSILDDLNHLINAKDEQKFKDYLGDFVTFGKGNKYAKIVDGVKNINTEEENSAIRDAIKADIQLEQEKNKQLFELTSEYTSRRDALEKASAELDKFNSEQQRKDYVEKAKEQVSVTIAKNKEILNSDLSTEKQKLDALKAIYGQDIAMNSINLINVTGTKKNPNLSSTAVDASIAEDKKRKEDQKALVVYLSEKHRIEDEYNNRYLKAVKETEKNAEDITSQANERIFKDEKRSMEDRLVSYTNYIQAKKNMEDKEYDISINKHGLTPEEKTKLDSDRRKAQINLEADAYKQIYDIVYTSSERQLKQIIDTNILQEESGRLAHAEELDELNESFRNKELSYEKYLGAVKRLRTQNKIDTEKQNIVNDLQELKRLEDFLKTQEWLRDEFAGAANAEKDPKKKDKLVAKYDAEVDAITRTQKEIKIVKERGYKDAEDAAKAAADKELEGQKELAQRKKQIQENLFKLAEQLINKEDKARLEQLEREKRTVDEQYGLKESAVERSEIDLKNKNALEIQLAEQKREYDIKSELEQRKIKHDMAVKDRDLSAAHAQWNTIESVTKTLAYFGYTPIGIQLAAAAAIAGELEVAAIMATDIPEYKFGTGPEKHPGGKARVGEEGRLEMIKEPYRSPYFVNTDQIISLPKDTEVIPMTDVTVSTGRKSDDWEKFQWLAGQLKPRPQKTTNNIGVVVNINNEYRKKILGRG